MPSPITFGLTIQPLTLTADSNPQVMVDASFDLTWDMGIVSRPIVE